MLALKSEREDSYSSPGFVNNDQRSRFHTLLVLTKTADNDVTEVGRENILGADLYYAWPAGFCGRQQRTKIEIVSKDRITIRASPLHDGTVRSFWVADLRPVGNFPSIRRENLRLFGRQVHIHKEFHDCRRGTSTSSARHAA